jgi:hypothetical protein
MSQKFFESLEGRQFLSAAALHQGMPPARLEHQPPASVHLQQQPETPAAASPTVAAAAAKANKPVHVKGEATLVASLNASTIRTESNGNYTFTVTPAPVLPADPTPVV